MKNLKAWIINEIAVYGPLYAVPAVMGIAGGVATLLGYK